MNTHLLIDAIVQQTMVFIAQLATSGGVRAPLAHVADQVFLDLTRELQNQGVTKKVIADMFGMALRTYHRRVQETSQSRTVSGRTVWEAVYDYIKVNEPVSGAQVLKRFSNDDVEVVSGVLNDLVHSGLTFRSGRGEGAVYRAASEADFALTESESRGAVEWLVWLGVYRLGDATIERIVEHTRLARDTCERALSVLVCDGKVAELKSDTDVRYRSDQFETPLGSAHGWEAAVLDHFQAMVSAISLKLRGSRSASHRLDVTGGSTWSFDIDPSHPDAQEVLGTLARLRAEFEELRRRVDAHNRREHPREERERVVVYVGQYVRPHN